MLLAVEGNTMPINEKDYTRAPFDKNWKIVVLELICKDSRGNKYCAIASLDAAFHYVRYEKLYTHLALDFWLSTKPKNKHLVTKCSIEEGLLNVPKIRLHMRKLPAVDNATNEFTEQIINV